MNKGKRLRKFGLIKSSSLVVLVILLIIGSINYFRPIPVITPINTLPTTTKPTTSLTWPVLGNAEAAIGAEGYGLLASSAKQLKQPTASTAKLVTALMVLKKYPLSINQTTTPILTLGAGDVAIYQQYLNEQGSVAAVEVGEQISEYQALVAMLLPSANNIADSLAIWAYGSLANYSAAANGYLSTLGLNNTIIGSDASGFSPTTLSTAGDLVTLGLDALQNPVIAGIVSQKQATIPVEGTVYNVNSLLARDDIVGIKTGNSNQAGGVYIFAVKDQIDALHNIIIVGAVEGTPNLSSSFSTGVELINFGEANFSLDPVVNLNQTVGYYSVPWLKKTVGAIASSSMSTVNWSTTVYQPQMTLQKIKAPRKSGSDIGSLALYHSDTNHDTINIITAGNIPSPPWWWRLMRF